MTDSSETQPQHPDHGTSARSTVESRDESSRQNEPRADQEAPFSDDPELAELDRLYRDALNIDTMEAVESDLGLVAETLNNDSEPARSPESPRFRGSETPGNDDLDKSRLTPTRIIEAVLFVGGAPLKTKKLCSLLAGEFDSEKMDRIIEDLNQCYSDERRPYEIRFGTGGYRMALRPEFERIRNRVYGLGPKDVKLSQEALEVLALVAYRQPITRQDVEALGKKNAGNLLRQLVRRELVAIRREEDDPKIVTYNTTSRFLQLFGLGDPSELPHADELSLK